MTEDIGKAFQEILNDPEALKRLQRSSELANFREKYNVDKASPLHCPACSQSGYVGGSLYFNKDKSGKCVCRKCFLEWKVECLTTPTQELISKLKKASKES